jgi:hypothetical protein
MTIQYPRIARELAQAPSVERERGSQPPLIGCRRVVVHGHGVDGDVAHTVMLGWQAQAGLPNLLPPSVPGIVRTLRGTPSSRASPLHRS